MRCGLAGVHFGCGLILPRLQNTTLQHYTHYTHADLGPCLNLLGQTVLVRYLPLRRRFCLSIVAFIEAHLLAWGPLPVVLSFMLWADGSDTESTGGQGEVLASQVQPSQHQCTPRRNRVDGEILDAFAMSARR